MLFLFGLGFLELFFLFFFRFRSRSSFGLHFAGRSFGLSATCFGSAFLPLFNYGLTLCLHALEGSNVLTAKCSSGFLVALRGFQNFFVGVCKTCAKITSRLDRFLVDSCLTGFFDSLFTLDVRGALHFTFEVFTKVLVIFDVFFFHDFVDRFHGACFNVAQVFVFQASISLALFGHTLLTLGFGLGDFCNLAVDLVVLFGIKNTALLFFVLALLLFSSGSITLSTCLCGTLLFHFA